MYQRKSHRLLQITLTFIYFLITLAAQAQDDADKELVGKFSKDSILVGEPVQFSLTYKHPINTQVLFPDSNYNFSPFEFVSKSYFPTTSDSLQSLDSVVYTLVSFETVDFLELSVPAYELIGSDSLEVFSVPDSVVVKAMVVNVPKELDLRVNSKLLSVNRQFNYPYVIIALTTFAFLSLLIFVGFGEALKRFYTLNTLGLRQRRFELIFQRLIKQWEVRKSTDVLEEILGTWRTHLERLENKPYSAFTSKEIVNLLPEYNLKETLQTIDASIYGINDLVIPKSHLTYLLDVSKTLYKRRKEVIRNARRNK